MDEAATEASCRLDLWLWRARLAKTRSQAARMVETGRMQRWRGEHRERMDKPARLVRIGDGLVFAVGGRLTAVRIAALGTRRGPPSEARALYTELEVASVTTSSPAP